MRPLDNVVVYVPSFVVDQNCRDWDSSTDVAWSIREELKASKNFRIITLFGSTHSWFARGNSNDLKYELIKSHFKRSECSVYRFCYRASNLIRKCELECNTFQQIFYHKEFFRLPPSVVLVGCQHLSLFSKPYIHFITFSSSESHWVSESSVAQS